MNLSLCPKLLDHHINVLSLIFVATCLPETKGKSLEALEKFLEKELGKPA